MIERILINLNLKDNRKLFLFLFYANLFLLLYAVQNIVYEVSKKITFGSSLAAIVRYNDYSKELASKGSNTARTERKLIPLDYFLVDNTNMFGGLSGIFNDPGSSIEKNTERDGRATVLVLNYSISQAGSKCGYWTNMNAKDISKCKALIFALQSDTENNEITIEFNDGKFIAGVPLAEVYPEIKKNIWKKIIIPMNSFSDLALKDNPELSLSIVFSNSPKGINAATVKIRNLGFLE